MVLIEERAHQILNRIGCRCDGLRRFSCMWFWNQPLQALIQNESRVLMDRWYLKASLAHLNWWIRCIYCILNTDVMFSSPQTRRVIRDTVRYSCVLRRFMTGTNIQWVSDVRLRVFLKLFSRFHTHSRLYWLYMANCGAVKQKRPWKDLLDEYFEQVELFFVFFKGFRCSNV